MMDCEQQQILKKCLVCYESTNPENIVRCQICSLSVHPKCYGIISKTRNDWKCRYCTFTEREGIDAERHNYSIKCRICNQNTFGALKPCPDNDGFAHLVCALYTSWIYVRYLDAFMYDTWLKTAYFYTRSSSMHRNQHHYAPIHNIEKCKEYKNVLKTLYCKICGKNHATIKCRVKQCDCFYHPLCLIGTKDQNGNSCMLKEIPTTNDKIKNTMFYVYCPKHAYLHRVECIVHVFVYILI